MSKLLDMAKDAVALAHKHGASEAAAGAYRTREVELEFRDGKVEKTSEATSRGVSLSLYVDGRYSAVQSSDLRPEALDAFVMDAVAMARTLAKDPYRSLPDPKLYAGRSTADLGLFDPRYESVTPDARVRVAKEMEEAARSVKGKESIISITSGVSDALNEHARFASNGFEGESQKTMFWRWADVSVRDPDGRRPSDGWSVSSRVLAELPSAAEVGRRAAERTIASIGAKKTESAVLKLVVESRAAGRLLGGLTGALGARALQQKQSFLEAKLGTAVAAKLLTITDDPLLVRGHGSRHWDGEGIAAKRFAVIDKGVLRAYYIDDYYGRKLKMAPTTAAASNLTFALGNKDLEGLLGGIHDGILVTSFLGGNSNMTTGDFSQGIQGFRIRKGKRAEPVSEMNMAGNHKELWMKLSAVGNDPWPYGAVRVPSLLFDGVQIAGT